MRFMQRTLSGGRAGQRSALSSTSGQVFRLAIDIRTLLFVMLGTTNISHHSLTYTYASITIGSACPSENLTQLCPKHIAALQRSLPSFALVSFFLSFYICYRELENA